MRILVTGATGGLGRTATEYLLAQGIQVVATGRNAEVGHSLNKRGAQFIAADLAHATKDVLAAMVSQVDAIWHCAALSSPWGPAGQFEDCNVKVTARLLDAAGHAGATRFVHISTPAIYFDYTHRYDVVESFRAAMPVNHYARTKAIAEDHVIAAGKTYPALRTCIIRPRAIFGPHDQVLMPRLLRVLQARNGRLPLPRGGRTLLDLTYVDNVVHAMWLATVNDRLPSGHAFNITNQEPIRIAEALQKLFVDGLKHKMKITDIPYPVLALGARALESVSRITGREPQLTAYGVGVLAFDMTLNLDRAVQMLGYCPSVSLSEGIERTVHWMQQHG